ncbi:MAG: hypothetical protein FJZ95_04155, partial [Chloroflexi bacterium]|nr:hypothetical protein [Chloroflexota bacterium]
MKKSANGVKGALTGILGALLLCFMIAVGISSPNADPVYASGGLTVWISDQNANTIFEALPLSKEGSTQSPFVVYDAAAEQEIINFVSQLSPAPAQ